MNALPLYALVGATATGKTEVAERLAERLGAEIVCADSRQVFRELEIGSGKPTPAERGARAHHLFEALAIEERASAGWYARAATGVIAGIRERGRHPMLVGGAGLYLRAVREGLAGEPALEPEARARLRAEHAEAPIEELRARLERLDPETAARLSPRDRQRTSRALEVRELSGRPLGWWLRQPAGPPIAGEWRVVELRIPPAELGRRIEVRTRAMFAQGLIEETRALAAGGREPALRALRAVGYDEALDLLAGRRTREQAEARTSERTRQLAKRQRTWFRHQVRAAIVEAGGAAAGIERAVFDAFRAAVPAP